MIASPHGFSKIRHVFIAPNRLDRLKTSPLHNPEVLEGWEKAFEAIREMPSLRTLQIFLWYHFVDVTQRPWKNEISDEVMEQRHKRLLDIMGTVHPIRYEMMLTWKPDDLLAQRKWPFQFFLQDKSDVNNKLGKLPDPTDVRQYFD